MIQAVTVSPCGRYAVSASIEHRVLVWDLKRMKAVEPVYTGTSWVRHLGLGRLFIGGRNTSGKGHAGQAPQAMQFLDARRLVTAADDVIVWDFPARAELGRLDDFAWGVQAMARDATRVFFGTHSELRGMTSDLSAVMLRCKAPAGGVTALCLHGDRVLVGGAKGAVWVMPTAGWQPAPRHLGSASEATAAPGDALVATADSDAVIRLWDFDTGAPRACLDRYPEPNHKPFAFSSDGALLATTHHERPPCVCLWDAATGALIRELHHQDASARKHQVGALVFAGDSLLVGPFGGGTIQRWSLDGERVSSGATKTCQISKLAIVGDVVVSIGYFSVRGVDAPWSGENDSVTHLQGWSAAGELLWTHASQPASKWQWSASFDSLHPLADGRLLTHSGRESGELALLDPRTGALLRTWKLGDDFSIVGVHEGVAIARVTKRLKRLGFDDVRIYVDPDDLDWSSSDHETRSWLARVDPDGAPTKLLDLPFGAMHLSVASAADRVAWTEDHAVVVAQLSSGRALARVELGESITSVVLRSDGARVFAGMRSGEGRVYALEGDA